MTALEKIISEEIGARGPISFARFMELALYHPGEGYYERGLKQTGRQGDFYTSVSVGSLYGELLAFDFSKRLGELGASELQIVEAGAHDGQLARDLLDYLREFRKEIFERVEYVVIEPSPARARVQCETLKAHDGKVRWVKNWTEVGLFRGICFSNELLDAMPVHVFRWDADLRNWFEWGVTYADGVFKWVTLPAEAADPEARRLIPELPEKLLAVLPNHFTVEASPAAVSWWIEAARALEEGWLMTVDYGLFQDDFFVPQRADGTLRAYREHRMSSDLLDMPGERDLTAHVNFTLIKAAGESGGLKTSEFMTQGIFLKTILEAIEASPHQFPLWTPMRYRQLTALIHPEHLGRSFKVLIQTRKADASSRG